MGGRVLSTLLNEMDGVGLANGLLVIGATNRPDMIDAALLRPGRFERKLYVPPPGLDDRYAILDIHSRRLPLDLPLNKPLNSGSGGDGDGGIGGGDDGEEKEKGGEKCGDKSDGHKGDGRRTILRELATLTDGFTGAELESLCREGALQALREQAMKILSSSSSASESSSSLNANNNDNSGSGHGGCDGSAGAAVGVSHSSTHSPSTDLSTDLFPTDPSTDLSTDDTLSHRLMAVRVTMEHFKAALRGITPGVDAASLLRYVIWFIWFYIYMVYMVKTVVVC